VLHVGLGQQRLQGGGYLQHGIAVGAQGGARHHEHEHAQVGGARPPEVGHGELPHPRHVVDDPFGRGSGVGQVGTDRRQEAEIRQ
jgi:hypothetical protein